MVKRTKYFGIAFTESDIRDAGVVPRENRRFIGFIECPRERENCNTLSKWRFLWNLLAQMISEVDITHCVIDQLHSSESGGHSFLRIDSPIHPFTVRGDIEPLALTRSERSKGLNLHPEKHHLSRRHLIARSDDTFCEPNT